MATFNALRFPTDAELRWLLAEDIAGDAMASPWPIRGANAKFEDRVFAFDETGERGIIFRAEDRGETIDLVAWQPHSGKLAAWQSRAFCLGDLEQVLSPATYFAGGALRVHRTPLEWLRAYRDGIVIVQPHLTYAYLRNARRLSFADAAHARQVEEWLKTPKPSVELLVEIPERAMA